MPPQWTAQDLFDFLTEQAGLPREHPADLDVTFEDIGLDSLAYLQLSAEVADRFGVELPAEMAPDLTLARILGTVNDALSEREPV
ncbi:acyl carrier protein [Frankia sp. R82]|uniref:acyl carrier protein n=1 Tax=Frankia sp. R82 TaxID=2950553 RepID=UPI0020437004|nr:acyl carrier protein [Frankia sp. R82]MCM3886728.1 acyl carrier protein [Frankia sp. R82]